MKSISGKDLARLLEKHGWELKRVTGSHHIYAKPGDLARISIPIHGNRNLKTGLLRHLLKLSGIDENALQLPGAPYRLARRRAGGSRCPVVGWVRRAVP